MDFLTSQDPAIVSELVVFLTEKLKKEKASLALMKQENEQIREELDNIRRESKSDDDIDTNEVICGTTDCPLTDYVKHLKGVVHALREERGVQLQRHHDDQEEIARLGTTLESVEASYALCKATLKACREELHGLKHSAGVEESEPAVEIDYSMSPPAHNRDLTSDLPTNEGLDSQSLPLKGKEVIDANTPRNITDQAGTVCLPENVNNPHKISEEIRQLSQHGFLFIPDCTMAKAADSFAWVYMPLQKCTPGDALSWTDNADFDDHRGKIRDLFYKGHHGICYGGTYEYAEVVEMSTSCFRCLRRELRDALFERTFTISPKDVPDNQWETVFSMYWDGTAKLKRFRFKRIGFNQPLYDALLAARGPTPQPCVRPDERKRKLKRKSEHQGPSAPKRPKH